MLRKHTLWIILIRNMSVAQSKWFYRNIKYLGLKVLKCNSASRSVWESAFIISLCLAKHWYFYNLWSCGNRATTPLSRKKRGGGGGGREGEREGVQCLANPDNMSYWKGRRAFIWSRKDVHIVVAGTCQHVTLHAKRTLQRWLRWRTLTWRENSGLSRWTQPSRVNP